MEQKMEATETQEKKKESKENPMRNIFIEKVLLSAGGTEQDLERAEKLLNLLSGKKSQVITSSKRIPDFGVRPGLQVGVRVTVRGKESLELLGRLLGAKDNLLKIKQISDNHFSFGIPEYIEIPEMEYQREIGTRGLNVTVDFARAGLRVKRKKIKSGHVPKKQAVSKEEIIKFMEDNFSTQFE